MFLIVNLDSRPDRLAAARRMLPGPAERFPATRGSIPDTYHRLQVEAHGEGWDLDTIVLQDDQRFIGPLDARPLMRGSKLDRTGEPEIVVYGTLRRHGHVCPRAFAATPRGWELLEVWDGTPGPGRDGRGIICPTWRPVVEEWGIVLNVVGDLER